MGLKIISSGLLTTIQDGGRHGHQKEGIIVSGPMDAFALRVGNLLVGNKEDAAGIETTFLGPRIRFESDQLIAITGGDLSPALNGEKVKMWRPVRVTKGSLLEFGAPCLGCRAYLTVSGSFNLPRVIGSVSTFLRAEFGGFKGRTLQAGDLIPCAGPTPLGRRLLRALAAGRDEGQCLAARWTPNPSLFPDLADPVIRVLKGPEFTWFSEESQAAFWEKEFMVTSDSDRMGYRLQGVPLGVQVRREMISSAVTFGTVQVPPEGHPIALMADRQTTGGYPRIAQIITADFSRLAQVPLGKKVHFREVTLPEAQAAYFRREQDIAQIKRALAMKAR